VARKASDWFIGERMESLAIVYLTRRPDLTVRRETREGDRVVDLMVEIVDPERPGWKKFGVHLQGTKTPVTVDQANKAATLDLRRFRSTYGEPTLPYCLFYFTIDDGQAYVTWIAEPVIRGGRPKLQYHKVADCTQLDREALDRIVERINAWYDAYYSDIKV
jgi:hypothetical protein